MKKQLKTLAASLLVATILPSACFASTVSLTDENFYVDNNVATHEYSWEIDMPENNSRGLPEEYYFENSEWVYGTGDDNSSISHRAGYIASLGYMKAKAETYSYQPDGSDNYHYTRVRLYLNLGNSTYDDSGRVWGYGHTTATSPEGRLYEDTMHMKSYWGTTV